MRVPFGLACPLFLMLASQANLKTFKILSAFMEGTPNASARFIRRSGPLQPGICPNPRWNWNRLAREVPAPTGQ